MRPQPSRGDHGQAVQRRPHGLCDALQAVDGANARQNLGRVGALPAAGFEPTPLAAAVQNGVQQPLFGAAADQACAELTEYREVEAGVRQFQAEGIFPIEAGADGIGRLPVGQVLDELKDGDQGEPPGGLNGSAAAGVEGGEVLVGEDGAQFVAQVEIGVAVGEGGASDPGGVVGDGNVQLSAQGHRALQGQCEVEWCEG